MLVIEMNNKQQQIPAIRFNGFTDTWEQRKLGNVVKNIGTGNSKFQIQEKSSDASYAILGSTSVIGYDNNFDFEGNFVLTARVGANAGTLYQHSGKVKISDNTVYIQSDNLSFLYNLLNRFDLKKLSFGTGQPLVKSSELKKLALNFPNKEEQEKIGNFFNQLDYTIALHQRQLDNYKELKKSMLQKIFNQELRFKDENGNDYPDWMEIALKELGETFTGLSGKTKENFGKGKGKFVTYMNVFSNPKANLAMTENVEIKDGENQNEVCYGDIFFTTSSETPEEVGMSSVWLSHESNVYLNSFCFGYRLNTESEGKVTHQFLGIQLRAEHIRKKIVLLAQGSTRFNISKAKLIEIPVYLPTIQEQQKITDFLLIVEARIDQTTQKIEWMKEQKKGLMQRMFI